MARTTRSQAASKAAPQSAAAKKSARSKKSITPTPSSAPAASTAASAGSRKPKDRALISANAPANLSVTFRNTLNTNGKRAVFVQKRVWKPQVEGGYNIDEEEWLTRLYNAIVDFTKFYKGTDALTKGRFTTEDLELACWCLLKAVEELHTTGARLHPNVDPTVTQVYDAKKKVMRTRINHRARDMTAKERLEAIEALLKIDKKMCEHVICTNSTIHLIKLIVAAPKKIMEDRKGWRALNDTRPPRAASKKTNAAADVAISDDVESGQFASESDLEGLQGAEAEDQYMEEDAPAEHMDDHAPSDHQLHTPIAHVQYPGPPPALPPMMYQYQYNANTYATPYAGNPSVGMGAHLVQCNVAPAPMHYIMDTPTDEEMALCDHFLQTRGDLPTGFCWAGYNIIAALRPMMASYPSAAAGTMIEGTQACNWPNYGNMQ